MDIQFEATRPFCYKFGRYTVLAEVQQMPEVTVGGEFRLTGLAQRVMDKSKGKWRGNVPGVERFNTTVAEVQSILEFVGRP